MVISLIWKMGFVDELWMMNGWKMGYVDELWMMNGWKMGYVDELWMMNRWQEMVDRRGLDEGRMNEECIWCMDGSRTG